MMKGSILCANGVEDTELVTFRDVLLRSHQITLDMVSIDDAEAFMSSHRLLIKANKKLSEVSSSDYDFIYLPGGSTGVSNILHCPKALTLIKEFAAADKYLVAICAAPSILGTLGLLDDKNYTCFPGFETGKGNYTGKETVADGKVFTGRSMYFSYQLAIDFLVHLYGEDILKVVEPGTKGLAHK